MKIVKGYFQENNTAGEPHIANVREKRGWADKKQEAMGADRTDTKSRAIAHAGELHTFIANQNSSTPRAPTATRARTRRVECESERCVRELV